eukprot:5452958-Pleurochrysis_carterae.AAC.1
MGHTTPEHAHAVRYLGLHVLPPPVRQWHMGDGPMRRRCYSAFACAVKEVSSSPVGRRGTADA